jgi:Rab3 GTPase-activating protein catalytic subunit
MDTELQQLHRTMASALRPLQGIYSLTLLLRRNFFFLTQFSFVAVNRLSADSETIEDLIRLGVVFERVEKLLTIAASLHRKLVRAPRLSREIFSDYYSFYIPTLGIGLTEDAGEKVQFIYTLK